MRQELENPEPQKVRDASATMRTILTAQPKMRTILTTAAAGSAPAADLVPSSFPLSTSALSAVPVMTKALTLTLSQENWAIVREALHRAADASSRALQEGRQPMGGFYPHQYQHVRELLTLALYQHSAALLPGETPAAAAAHASRSASGAQLPTLGA